MEPTQDRRRGISARQGFFPLDREKGKKSIGNNVFILAESFREISLRECFAKFLLEDEICIYWF